jgi:2-polyprenyl-3-methyl-5-hydroxy-6-metoxy-1,4-benzoquinol methylase
MINLDKLFPPNSKSRKFLKTLLIQAQWVPKYISKNFKYLDESSIDLIRASLEKNYFSESYTQTELGQEDLLDHLFRRLEMDRRLVAPWLNSAKPLKEAHILEIGCGTGSSTISLAEQGARVTALDICEKSLAVARERCKIYGLDVEFHQANATEAHKILINRHFDFIIFYASLEHMTLDERLNAMHSTWEMLSPGDLWCVIESPNRLWYYDSHTSLLPFYDWLPDDLALRYARFSPRKNFNEKFKELTPESQLAFLRMGRGISFHECELAMKPFKELNIVSCMWLYNRKRNPLIWLKWRFSVEYQYDRLLSRICPAIDKGFLQPWLDLIIKK